MASSTRLSSTGVSCRLTAMLSGSGADFGRGLVFSMGLILCLCGGLIACFAVLSAQMRQPAQVVAADKAFNARCCPLIDLTPFRKPRLRMLGFSLPQVNLPYPDPEILPTEDPCPKTLLHPRTPAVTPAADAPGAVEVR